MASYEQDPSTGGQPFTQSSRWRDVKGRVHQRLLESLDMARAKTVPIDRLHRECSERIDQLLAEQRASLSTPEKARLVREILDEVFGLGPLEEFLRDPEVTDILVNGAHQVYIERYGRLEHAEAEFRDNSHLLHVIQRIASRVGRRIDESSPMLDARLLDGARVNAIIPPLALDGPMLSIRRFGARPIDMDRLVELHALTSEMHRFLAACVQCRLNVLISGGTGSGKTTMLNALSAMIPDESRVITIEDAAELKLQREHVVRLETRPANIEGKGECTQRDLLRNSLRMRPDRIVIGEVRGPEALDMLQAMNTGHEGSMTTVHANNPRDALRRVENMVSMAGLNYPVGVIRDQIASALDLLVHLDRLTGGRRRLVTIAEITGMEGNVICLQDLFVFRQTGIDPEGHAEGVFESCGVRPRCMTRLLAEGCELPRDLFERRVLYSTKRKGASDAAA